MMRQVIFLLVATCACPGSKTPGGPSDSGSTFTGTAVALATGVAFTPASFLSSESLRTSLAVYDGNLFFTDVTDVPVKRMSLAGGPATGLAIRAGPPQRLAVSSSFVFWTDGSRLFKTALDGSSTARLTSGNLYVTPAILTDESSVYWIRAVSSQECSSPCRFQVESISPGGAVTVLAQAQRLVSGFAQDNAYLYWEENSLDPIAPGCNCGSAIKRVAKTGGDVTVLVDATLNGLIGPPPPGYIAGSWIANGGIALDADSILFAHQISSGFELLSVPIGGGAVTPGAQFPDPPLALAVGAGNAVWAQPTSVSTAALAGGSITTLASGIRPGGLLLAGDAVLVSDLGPYAGCCSAAGAGRILSIPLSGGTPAVLAGKLDAPSVLQADASRIYWAEAWRVGAAPLSGGAPATLAGGLSDRLPRMVVDGSRLLVLDREMIKAIPLTGGVPEKIAGAGAIDDLGSTADDLAAGPDAVYLLTSAVGGQSSVAIFPRDGSPSSTVAPAGFGHPTECVRRVAADGHAVYWTAASPTSRVECAVFSAPVAGGPATVVADLGLVDFTLAGPSLFVTAHRRLVVDGAGSHYDGFDGVGRIPISTGVVTQIPTPGFPSLITADSSRVYWISALSGVESFTLDGAGYSALAPGAFTEGPELLDTIIAVDGKVYWTDFAAGIIGRFTPT